MGRCSTEVHDFLCLTVVCWPPDPCIAQSSKGCVTTLLKLVGIGVRCFKQQGDVRSWRRDNQRRFNTPPKRWSTPRLSCAIFVPNFWGQETCHFIPAARFFSALPDTQPVSNPDDILETWGNSEFSCLCKMFPGEQMAC